MNVCDFGAVLKQLRKSRGLTQKELGLHIGLSKAVISKYENGLGYPSFDTLLLIARYFGVTTDYLLGAESGRTVDVSALTDSQADAVRRIIAEFKKSNNE